MSEKIASESLNISLESTVLSQIAVITYLSGQ